MEKQLFLRNLKVFTKYVVPSMFGMVIAGIYTLVSCQPKIWCKTTADTGLRSFGLGFAIFKNLRYVCIGGFE